jgi:hypothetical protein
MMFTLFFSPFSAVSTPIFAISYALESCWRDVQIPQSPRDLNFQIFANIVHVDRKLANFVN